MIFVLSLIGYYAWLEKDSFMLLQRHNTIVMFLFISSNSILRLISNRLLALCEQSKYLEVEEITASLCLPLQHQFWRTCSSQHPRLLGTK